MQDNFSKYLTTKNIVFGFMIILAIIFIAKIIDVALMFFGAFVFSAAIKPLVDRLEKIMPRILAVSIVVLFALGIIIGIFVPLIVVTIKQGVTFINDLPNHIIQFKRFLIHYKFMGIHPFKHVNTSNFSEVGSGFLSGALKQSINITKIIANGLTTFLAVTIMIFYLSYDKAAIKKVFVSLFPQNVKEKAVHILDSITERVGGFVLAQFLAMLFVGIFTTAGLLILGHEHAFILGFIAFVLDIIPVVGPTIATLTGVIFSFQGGIGYILLVLVIYLGAQLIENQFLRPLMLGKFMDIHPLTIIIALLISAKFFGAWGVILAPALASVVCVIIDELYVKEINKEITKENN